MQVRIVRSAEPGCEPQCAEWIAADGRIDAGALRQFRKLLSQLGTRKLPILIDSAGGSVDEALAIGRLIRASGLDVAVARTEFSPCAAVDAACHTSKAKGALPGRPGSTLSKCASSCAFILAGGVRRHVGPRTLVGVHQLTSYQTKVKVLRTYRVETRRELGEPVQTRKTLVSEKRIAESTVRTPTRDSDYQRIASYFSEMGIGDGVMRALRATPSSSIHWFTRPELQATKLATELTDGGRPVGAASAARPDAAASAGQPAAGQPVVGQ